VNWKKLMITVVAAMFVLTLSNCSLNTNTIKVTDRKPETYMWLIKSEKATVYLLGSVHIGKKENYPLHEKIENAYASADCLVVEANVTSSKELEQQKIMLQLASLPKEKTLKEVVPEKLYSLVDVECKKLGFPITAFERYKPWLIALNISSLKTLQGGYNPMYGIDRYFLNKAELDNKDIAELESLDFQLKLLDSISLDIQNEFLEQTCTTTVEDYKKLTDEMYTCWKNADPEKMNDIVKRYENDTMIQLIFRERDKGMAEKITDYLKTNKTYFIVVGSAHLTGEGSVIDLLKKKGFDPVQQ